MFFCHHIRLRSVAALPDGKAFFEKKSCNSEQLVNLSETKGTSPLSPDKGTKRLTSHDRAKQEQAPHSTKEGKAEASLHHLLPNLLSKLLCNHNHHFSRACCITIHFRGFTSPLPHTTFGRQSHFAWISSPPRQPLCSHRPQNSHGSST